MILLKRLHIRLGALAFSLGLITAYFGMQIEVHAVVLKPGDIIVSAILGNGSQSSGLALIDPVTGNRTVISDYYHGSGPKIVNAWGVTQLPNGLLLVVDHQIDTLFQVDPATGNRTVLSQSMTSPPGTLVGTGTYLTDPYSVRMNGDRIYVSELGLLVRVDPTTGNRVSNSNLPLVDFTSSIAIDSNSQMVVDYGHSELLNLNLTTGQATVFSGAGVGLGPNLSNPGDITRDANGDYLVSNVNEFSVYRINHLTGDRTVVSSATVGSGPLTNGDAYGIAVEADGTILMAGNRSGILYKINPVTGDRTILSGPTQGSGTSMSQPIGVFVVPNVPEPSTMILAAVGGLGLIAFGLRGRSRNFTTGPLANQGERGPFDCLRQAWPSRQNRLI